MPRRLNDYEWAAFLQAVPICPYDQSQEANVQTYCSGNVQVLPPWGAVIEWGGMDILAFLGAPRDLPDLGLFDVREVYLTDISDLSDQWKSQVQPQYNQWADVFWYSLPSNIFSVLRDQAVPYAENVLEEAGKVIGKTAGGILGPVLQPLALPLALIGIVLLFIYLPKPR